MNGVEIVGWIASGLTILTYSMRTMVPLRVLAILSSLFFLIYALLLPSFPLLVMELVLLPFNCWRLSQIVSMRARVRAARGGSELEFGLLRRIGAPRAYAAGDVVFAIGDAPDHLYFIERGQVDLLEPGVTLGAGDVFGEIAFFTDAKRRTATAICRSDCRIFAVNEEAFLQLYFLDPTFAMAILRLIVRRLTDPPAAGAPQAPLPPTD